ncbi:hypothetical protein NLG97_g10719 [Lecanicillium saksenae]|uniref:Uncharacterized protein n=1 Tax=Lecanicillium saksenae TaxID=468837 RepID=A0ACC1QCJ8_9HYPO|nr:hypothetical protein NLG97_g10719 [Lecanicillium saksenae]
MKPGGPLLRLRQPPSPALNIAAKPSRPANLNVHLPKPLGVCSAAAPPADQRKAAEAALCPRLPLRKMLADAEEELLGQALEPGQG